LVKWLLEKGVPVSHVFLHLSPLEQNVPDLEAFYQAHPDLKMYKATLEELLDTLHNKLQQIGGDSLVVFWAGHGAYDRRNRSRLLYMADSQRMKQTINLDRMLAYLRDDLSLSSSYFTKQFVFIDACANDLAKVEKRYQFEGHPIFPGEAPILSTKE